jgi:hypothetical protein
VTTEGSEFEYRWGQEFSLLHVVQIGSGVHPTSYTICNDVLSLGVKLLGLETDHSHPTSAEVKKTWVYTSIPPHVFIA